ncbi:Disulfide bond formation protein DsbA [Bosea sp. 62]|uniref:DsbA family protein n=1 Tax=unclassified Bosea (in: a-proteobacteria) TaxID=2653178 RepID=UPI001258211B|nr:MULTISPECIES: DsbA family protein [unclassified Bosea (in: a-proteobacteria)]CAD5289146.1 Disulfide bond formation protein DsbA [Bosea sp. 21B]CAD5291481.1 Disulfide bond formation protein DsbA [Bosea sp. 46]CAD5300571.1 Disulfide bond formation protein DsbA [Bosea sp. 7B]VVT60270.1 Disulfide bond formation protein DsbA [Bosea sp. EC-HK365B]VXA93573.1 Disulfide bond formation protein DsbA [Bosea sp. 62]
MLDRRLILQSLAFGLAGSLSLPALAQAPTALLDPGPLPEKVFGAAEAPVTVIEYASLTCHHCMNFHMKTWPEFKGKYVDSGKVRFIIREFPLDPLAMAGFMLARCAGEDKWYPVVDMLYRTQESWAHSDNPLDGLTQAMRQTGMGKDGVEACLKREDIYQGIKQVSERGKGFGVESTPTFFVNGKKEVGALSLEQFDAILAPLLAGR